MITVVYEILRGPIGKAVFVDVTSVHSQNNNLITLTQWAYYTVYIYFYFFFGKLVCLQLNCPGYRSH